jgi:hypothetical protein
MFLCSSMKGFSILENIRDACYEVLCQLTVFNEKSLWAQEKGTDKGK